MITINYNTKLYCNDTVIYYRVRQIYGNAHFDLVLEKKRRKLKNYCSSL